MAKLVKIVLPKSSLREEPRPDGRVLLELEQGQELELLEPGQRYSQARYRDYFHDVTGWIANVAIGVSYTPASPGISAIITCPYCGSTDWVELGVYTGQLPGLTIGGGLFTGYPTRSRTCLGCGNVQLFLATGNLASLRSNHDFE